jgi:hypothetical protein
MCGRYVSPDEAGMQRAWHIGRQNREFLQGMMLLPVASVKVMLGENE